MYDVGVIGDVAGFDLVLAEGLTRRGFRCSVAVRRGGLASRQVRPPAEFRSEWHSAGLAEYDDRYQLLSWTRKCRIVVSLGGGLLFGLGPLWPFGRLLGVPPVIGYATGSDLAELAVASGRLARAFRYYLRSVDINWGVPFPYVLENMIRLRTPRVVFMGFPYDLRGSEELDIDADRHLRRTGPISLLHCSNLDWGVNDPGVQRRSTKGNDRCIRAVAAALAAGADLRLTIVDRGPDRGPARQLVRELALDERVEWLPALGRDELYRQMVAADIVVDQFDVGGLGGIAIEAMSLGAPVLTYIHEPSARIQYGADLPPILNASGEAEIRARMVAADRRDLHALGIRASAWAIRHHRWDHCLDQFVFCFERLTGRRLAPA